MQELSMEEFFNKSKRDKHLRHCTDQPGSEDVPHGKIKYEKYDNYFNREFAIETSRVTDPQDFDDPAYFRLRVHDMLEHNADTIDITNTQPTGGAQLFVIEAHKSVIGFSFEVPIDPQQTKHFYNIYEIRLRSPIATDLAPHIFRASTYPIRAVS